MFTNSTVERMIYEHKQYLSDPRLSLHDTLAQIGLHSVPARGGRRAIRNAYGTTLLVATAHEAWQWLKSAGGSTENRTGRCE